jgi:hypothetical protein
MLNVRIKDHFSQQESGIHGQSLLSISLPLTRVLIQYFYTTATSIAKEKKIAAYLIVVVSVENACILFILNAVKK